jgi:transposase
LQQSQTKLREKRPQVAKKMNKLLLLYRVFQGIYFSRELGSKIQTNERNKIYCQGLKFQTNEEAKKSPEKFSKEFSFCFPEFWVNIFSYKTKKKKKNNLQILGSQDFLSQTKRTYQQSAKFTNALLSKRGVCVFKEGD